ncbi:uncharacterized protein J8A68_003169 [[Candida] subhashii]|uniref:Importin N-terminal domain-containing protein n=1 Tax=[Candida] subhashii TaxID=561895 RepID=A0A8J5QPC2_9ASCO|nr:uncharacterized protein J8A68_003169 [[Candida] subhashii]KAG7663337.1 hypothetical protein J8A68_003169 [[Candida] subhashii]
MSDLLIGLIVNQTSPENNIRKSAEIEFNQIVQQDPSQAARVILESAFNEEYPLDIRQACLLHLKRLVPKYWSLGFESFIGPPIDQELKQIIRTKLLELATTSAQSKLRSGSAYAIVQIASADYPDEWPELLNQLYQATTSFDNEYALIGGLNVLTDLFDDLITEEQFWEGGIANEITNHINNILSRDLSADVKAQAIKLYSSVVAILRSPEAFNSPERKQFVINHVGNFLQIFIKLLETSYQKSTTESFVSLTELNLRTLVYTIISTLVGDFHKKIPQDVKARILKLALDDFHYISNVFKELMVEENKNIQVSETSYQSPASIIMNNVIGELIQTISCTQLDIAIRDVVPSQQFITDLIQTTLLTKQTIEEYEADINTYVSDITGLSTVSRARDYVYELLGELNDSDSSEVFAYITNDLHSDKDWRVLEAKLFILESMFANDDVELQSNISTLGLLNTFTKFITYDQPLITSRCFILLSKFFEKFSDMKQYASKAFSEMISFSSQVINRNEEAMEFIKISTLVSCTYYKHVVDFSTDLENPKEIQISIFRLAASLIEDCEEDGLPALLEAITDAITIDPANATGVQVAEGTNVVDIILKISFKDPANVQLIVDASDCLTSLLANISIQDYLIGCEKSLPFIFDIMKREISQGQVEYSPELYLAMELLNIIIESVPPTEDGLPSQIFYYAFPVLKNVLLSSFDNQILQSGGEVFNHIIQKASKLFLEYQDPETRESGIDCMMSIVYKFLSPELSDSAANNCGSIVLSLIDKYQSYLSSEFLTQILEATVKRLVVAKESITIENLIMVFCKLVLNSPEEMINFLSNNINLETPQGTKNGLEIILPIWFESYEVTRGYEHIKQNSIALGKIFTLGDSRVENLIVNGEIIPYDGDLIITRSMAKSMPDKYTQIPASLKILKLLCGELEFQCQQPNAEDYLPENIANEDGDDEGWEDMEDIGVPNFEKLKSYVESDGEDDGGEHEDQKGDEGLKNLLVQFFKECTGKDLGHFRKYYEHLSDHEKKIITECLVF